MQAAELAVRGTQAAALNVLTARRVEVTYDSGDGPISVAVDGEALTLPTPVVCTLRPRALRVLVPRDRPGITPRRRPSTGGASPNSPSTPTIPNDLRGAAHDPRHAHRDRPGGPARSPVRRRCRVRRRGRHPHAHPGHGPPPALQDGRPLKISLSVAAVLALFPGRPRRAALAGVGAIAVASATANLLGKRLVRRPRPDREAARVVAGRHVPMPDSASFPRGTPRRRSPSPRPWGWCCPPPPCPRAPGVDGGVLPCPHRCALSGRRRRGRRPRRRQRRRLP